MKSLLVVVLVVGLKAAALAQSPPEIFASANKLYQEGKFPEARDHYESLLANGYEGSALYLNLGNTYFRMGNIARAVLSYERGLRLAPNDDDLQFNRTLAGMMTVDRIESTPRLFVWDYWDSMKSPFSLQGIFWSAYAAYVVFFFLLAGMILAGSFTIRRISLFGAIGVAMVFVLFLAIGIARYSDLTRTDSAVIVAEIVPVKNSPDEASTDAFVLHAGASVRITDTVGKWVQIRIADGKVGWVEASVAEVI
jgi:tetratricopeptide (TPR) repeat protein